MAEKLLQHKHCIRCGRAIQADKDYCDKECRTAHAEMLGKKKRQLLMFYIGSVVVVIVLLLLTWGTSS